MNFVVYDTNTFRYDTYGEERTAKSVCTRRNNKAVSDYAEHGTPIRHYAVASQKDFDENINVEVDTYNMLNPSAGPIKIRKSELGGPCDPATETYHSS